MPSVTSAQTLGEGNQVKWRGMCDVLSSKVDLKSSKLGNILIQFSNSLYYFFSFLHD